MRFDSLMIIKAAVYLSVGVFILLALVVLAACSGSPFIAATPTTSESPTPLALPDGRWIEVVLEDQIVYLHGEGGVIQALPISSGVGNTPETTTSTGEFHVATMYRGPEETSPGIFVRDIVIFDWEHGNGFHSLPMDEDGQVLDSTIGTPASAGCIRVRDSGVLYEFATLGMLVVIR